MKQNDYAAFLRSKVVTAPLGGFAVPPEEISRALKPHQRDAVIWALKGGRRGLMTELNPDYYRDAVGYLTAEEDDSMENISLFDLMGEAT